MILPTFPFLFFKDGGMRPYVPCLRPDCLVTMCIMSQDKRRCSPFGTLALTRIMHLSAGHAHITHHTQTAQVLPRQPQHPRSKLRSVSAKDCHYSKEKLYIEQQALCQVLIGIKFKSSSQSENLKFSLLH